MELRQGVVHPLYLDVPMLVSFLAAIDDGIGLESEHTEQLQAAKDREGDGTVRFGLGSIASLLGLTADASGSVRRRTSTSEHREVRVLRQHTEASLFNVLRQRLIAGGEIVHLADRESLDGLVHGTIVEFTATITGDPLTDLIDIMVKAAPLALATNQEQTGPHQAVPQGPRPKKGAQGPRRQTSAMEHSVEDSVRQAFGPMGELLLALRDDLSSSSVRDLAAQLSPELSAVLTITRDFLPIQGEALLTDGTFGVIGKVFDIRAVGSDISLLRRSTFGMAVPANFEGELRSLTSKSGLDLTIGRLQVSAPLVQVLPLAIFI